MAELTELLKSIPNGKAPIERLDNLNEEFQKKQQEIINSSKQSATSNDTKRLLQHKIDAVNQYQVELAVQLNNLHRLYNDLSTKSERWKNRLESESKSRISIQQKNNDWFAQSVLTRRVSSDIIAKVDSSSIHLEPSMSWNQILPASSAGVRVMVHSVLHTEKEASDLLQCEQNIPYFHDLYITTSELNEKLLCRMYAAAPKAKSVTVRRISDKCESLASLLGVYGREITRHEIVFNLDFNKIQDINEGRTIRNMLCGSKERVEQIFSLFQSDGNVGLIYSGDLRKSADPLVFTFEDYPKALKILSRWNVKYADKAFIYPENNTFWCKTEILRPILGNRWEEEIEEESEESQGETKDKIIEKEGENSWLQEEKEAYSTLSEMDDGLLSHCIGYLCEAKHMRQCVTSLDDDFLCSDVREKVRNQFDWENLGQSGLEQFTAVCFEVCDTLITEYGKDKYCARKDILNLYKHLQNCGIVIYLFNDLGTNTDVSRILTTCGYYDWDEMITQPNLIPRNNTCLICAHRIQGMSSFENQRVLLSPERLLSFMRSDNLRTILGNYGQENWNIIVKGEICNRANILSNHDEFCHQLKICANTLLYKGFMEAALQQIPVDSTVLTIGKDGRFLKHIWEQQSNRQAYFLELDENILHQAFVCDRETLMGLLNRPFEGTIGQLMKEKFNLTVRKPYSDITVEIPKQREDLDAILDPLCDTIVRSLAKKRIFCENKVTNIVKTSEKYILLTIRPSVRTCYELEKILKAPVIGINIYSSQKNQWKKSDEHYYINPFPDFLLMTQETALGVRYSERLDQLASTELGPTQMLQKEEQDRFLSENQKLILQTLRQLKYFKAGNITEYYRIGKTVLQLN